MGDSTLLTAMLMENHHPSTLLSMEFCGGGGGGSSHDDDDDFDLEINPQIILSLPPDINVPLSAEGSPSPQQPWDSGSFREILDVGLGSQVYMTESYLTVVPKGVRKCTKRVDSIWAAWFFFSFYFKPAFNKKSKDKILRDCNGVMEFDKSNLELDVFIVQHDLENIYMWVFKDRPENALGKMQLRSYMNGHSRQGENPFPFSVDKGFVRSHRMQRKQYRGLSNPQCVHGIEVVSQPNLAGIDEKERKRWIELTGRDVNFTIPPEASDFSSWRNLPSTDFDPPLKKTSNCHSKNLLRDAGLNLSVNCKKRKEVLSNGTNGDCYLAVSPPDHADVEVNPHEAQWLNKFSGVMKNVSGPVTGAKTIYEDEEGYLIIVSLPFVDLQKVKVSWRNTSTHGIVKISGMSLSRMPFTKRCDRTFKLADPDSEHCPPGEFVREIPLSTRIPEHANIVAYCDSAGSGLEIMVPKPCAVPEEHEVQVCLRPRRGSNGLMLT
ncbi:hypothetical protein ACFE04_001276 [Oxalis oulophora]